MKKKFLNDIVCIVKKEFIYNYKQSIFFVGMINLIFITNKSLIQNV